MHRYYKGAGWLHVGEAAFPYHQRSSPGSLGYTETMLLAYNRKCKYPLQWTNLFEKKLGITSGLDVDLPNDDANEVECKEES